MAFWSLHLADALLEGLTDATLRRSWGSKGRSDCGAELRAELSHWSLVEDEIRFLLMTDWRRQEASVVKDTESLAIEELIERWDKLAPLHGPERLLLALLTEAHEDTEENVALLLSGVSAGARRAAKAFWDSLQERDGPAVRSVLLVGGDPSERARVDAMARKYHLRVNWVPAVRSRGYGPSQDSLASASRADLVLVVTGRIGHTLMHGARRAAERLQAPCHYIEKLSERQLEEALAPR